MEIDYSTLEGDGFKFGILGPGMEIDLVRKCLETPIPKSVIRELREKALPILEKSVLYNSPEFRKLAEEQAEDPSLYIFNQRNGAPNYLITAIYIHPSIDMGCDPQEIDSISEGTKKDPLFFWCNNTDTEQLEEDLLALWKNYADFVRRDIINK